MPRKAGRKRIRAAMKQYAEWRSTVDDRIGKLANADARRYLTEWADEVRSRIENGELGICTTALASSVIRDIKSWEDGFYSHVDENGGRVIT